jgi:hypothetical protein
MVFKKKNKMNSLHNCFILYDMFKFQTKNSLIDSHDLDACTYMECVIHHVHTEYSIYVIHMLRQV